MSRSIRYHLDHDLNRCNAIANALRAKGIDVTLSRQLGLAGASDDEQREQALRAGRVIVTHDAHFIGFWRHQVQHAGIVRCRQGELAVGDVIRGLVLIWETCSSEEMTGSIIFLNRSLIKGL
ncbi:DUF5615 family PIN-like protein [Tautonia sp. JC769]|uniref:DUF5615 family PIN-like protein n=1 Tax=Tautonia sp. JC769 TaxID=3232135 RepID=UPI003457F260